ncbi:glycosyltransferase family 4 protein [Gordonia amicalis]|uniref:glycosyltransferase family 4 protein n=1 Tax=Gordonia amicalis TaxID=89053 RepID=UPI0039E849BD
MGDTSVIINDSFRGQQVTGQQRYAIEISDCLLALPGFKEGKLPRSLPEALPSSVAKASYWAGVQLLPFRYSRDVILSLTSRAPIITKRSVYVTHDLFPITNPEWYSREYAALHSRLLRRQMERATALVAVSPNVAEQISEYSGRDVDEIVVAPNAPSSVFINGSALPGGKRDAVAGFAIDPNSRVILAVGSIEPRKNLVRLTAAVAKLNSCTDEVHTLLIVGGGASVFAGVPTIDSPHVVFAGRVSDDALSSLYRHCDAVVFPSLAEGFGLPNVEALAAGANLAVSDIPVFRWICGSGATYFDPLDSDSIAAGIEAALRAPRRLAEHDRVGLISRFQWKESAAAIARLCEKVASS